MKPFSVRLNIKHLLQPCLQIYPQKERERRWRELTISTCLSTRWAANDGVGEGVDLTSCVRTLCNSSLASLYISSNLSLSLVIAFTLPWIYMIQTRVTLNQSVGQLTILIRTTNTNMCRGTYQTTYPEMSRILWQSNRIHERSRVT